MDNQRKAELIAAGFLIVGLGLLIAIMLSDKYSIITPPPNPYDCEYLFHYNNQALFRC